MLKFTHIPFVLSFFLTTKTGAASGELDSLMTPIFMSVISFSDSLKLYGTGYNIRSDQLAGCKFDMMLSQTCCAWCFCEEALKLICKIHKLCSLLMRKVISFGHIFD